MSRKTRALYSAVFLKTKDLVPDFATTSAMTDFEEASVSAFQDVFGDINVAGCWFHYAQSIVKHVKKVGLRDAYTVRNLVMLDNKDLVSDCYDTSLCSPDTNLCVHLMFFICSCKYAPF